MHECDFLLNVTKGDLAMLALACLIILASIASFFLTYRSYRSFSIAYGAAFIWIAGASILWAIAFILIGNPLPQ